MSTRVAPSVLLEEQIAEVLSHGIDDGERLSEIGRLGARRIFLCRCHASRGAGSTFRLRRFTIGQAQ